MIKLNKLKTQIGIISFNYKNLIKRRNIKYKSIIIIPCFCFLIANIGIGPYTKDISTETINQSKYKTYTSKKTNSLTYNNFICFRKGVEFALTNKADEYVLTPLIDENNIIDEDNSNLSSSITKEENVIVSAYLVPNWEKECKSYNFTYMDYKMVTYTPSLQYQLLNSDRAYTDITTGIRMVDDRYAIAVGLGYGFSIGDYIDVVMENGEIFECIMGDAKSNVHTDDTNRYQKYDGSVVEMIIDDNYFKSTNQYPEGLKGEIVELRGIEKK